MHGDASRRRQRPSRPWPRSGARGCARRPARAGRARAASHCPRARRRRRPTSTGLRANCTVADRDVDAREILVDDPPGADVEVADFRVAHLAFRKSDAELGRVDRRMRAGGEQLPPVGRIGARDRVVGRVLATAEAVEDQQHDPAHVASGARCRGGGGRVGGVRCALVHDRCGGGRRNAPRAACTVSYHFSLCPCPAPLRCLPSSNSSPGTGRSSWCSCFRAPCCCGRSLQRRLSPAREIGTLDATRLINKENPLVLDVREPKEFAGGRLPNALHIPLSQLKDRGGEIAKHAAAPGDRLLRPRRAQRRRAWPR